jgi:hypothetical protein
MYTGSGGIAFGLQKYVMLLRHEALKTGIDLTRVATETKLVEAIEANIGLAAKSRTLYKILPEREEDSEIVITLEEPITPAN